MIVIALAGGFAGGLVRSLIGFWKNGKPPKLGTAVWAFVIAGIIGLEAGVAMLEIFSPLAAMDSAGLFSVAMLAGYVATDIANSFYKIFSSRGVSI